MIGNVKMNTFEEILRNDKETASVVHKLNLWMLFHTSDSFVKLTPFVKFKLNELYELRITFYELLEIRPFLVCQVEIDCLFI